MYWACYSVASYPHPFQTFPTAGPVEGGTLYTIRGSNLGAYPRENVTILIGGRECPINSSTDGSLTCVVPPAISEGVVNVTSVVVVKFVIMQEGTDMPLPW